MKHCCLKMEGALEEYGTPLHYAPHTRSYDIEYGTVFKNKETHKKAAILTEPLIYCPWCGTKLVRNLFGDWVELIKAQFNVNSSLDKEEMKKVPREYLTEEWWRKKGL